MSLAHLITPAICTTEVVLAILAVLAVGSAVWSFCLDRVAEGTVMTGLAVVGAFALVALDAARRGAGL